MIATKVVVRLFGKAIEPRALASYGRQCATRGRMSPSSRAATRNSCSAKRDQPESGIKIKLPGTDLDYPCVVSVATLAFAFLQRSGPASLRTEARKARSLRAFGGSLHHHATICAIG